MALEKTLYEQMHLSDVEIDRRKALLGLTDELLSELHACRDLIEPYIDNVVEAFYDHQTAIDEVVLLIGDADTLASLRRAQRQYIADLFAGDYGFHYVNNRLRIGLVHKRIGVEPKLYLAAVSKLKELLLLELELVVDDETRFRHVADALERLVFFDTTLVFDTYIRSLVNQVETSRQRIEEYAQVLEERLVERGRLNKRLEHLSRCDPLSELYNARTFCELLTQSLDTAREAGLPLSLVYFDIDRFKEINDSDGHVRGDEVIKAVGKALRDSSREVDVPCRCGGDEFCVIMPGCDEAAARQFTRRMLARLAQQMPDVGLSFGIAQAGPDDYPEAQTLIHTADQCMYAAKRSKHDEKGVTSVIGTHR